MEKIDKNKVRKIADLAKIRINKEEIDDITSDFGRILEFMNKINEFDFDEEKSDIDSDRKTPLRDDEVRLGLERDEALKNAPVHDHGFFITRSKKPDE